MKNLLFAIALIAFALGATAQDRTDRSRRAEKETAREYRMKKKSSDRHIETINRRFSEQMRYVKNNPYLTAKEKRIKLRNIEIDRKLAISRFKDKSYRNYRDSYSYERQERYRRR